MEALSKNRLSQLATYRLQKRCDEDGLFTVEGPKMCIEALQSRLTVKALCATVQCWQDSKFKAAADSALQRNSNVDAYEISQAQLERLSNQRTPNMVWMLMERPEEKRQSEICSDVVLALDGLQDPGNLGTILRTADWFGIRTVVCSRNTVSCFNSKAVQASMGAIFRTDVIYLDLEVFLQDSHKRGYEVYGAMLDGDNSYQAHLGRPAVVVIGNEGNGISQGVAKCLTRRLTIPNIGQTAESLNAATATAILCYEFCRNQNS